MTLTIARESPDTPDARALIAELDAVLDVAYPAESRHGYDVTKLIRQGVHFFVARRDGKPVACGGIQFMDGFGELKRMYARHRGKGYGRAMLDHLAAHARANGCSLLRLETGIHQHEALRLYERRGFTRIPAFAPYQPDPLSVFMEKEL